jgi:hypothetical protein
MAMYNFDFVVMDDSKRRESLAEGVEMEAIWGEMC